MNIIIRQGKAVETFGSSTALPLGVEYEELTRNLRENVEKEHAIKDMRKQKSFPLNIIDSSKPEDKIDKKTMMLFPGMLIDHETNMFSPYPQSHIPYSKGLPWE